MTDLVADVRRRRDDLRVEHANVLDEMKSVIDAAERRGDGRLTAGEQRNFDRLKVRAATVGADLDGMSERLEELLDQRRGSDLAAASRVQTGEASDERLTRSGWSVSSEPGPYYRGSETSYFLDLYAAQSRGNYDAAQRLSRCNAQAKERRALGNTSGTGGSGAEFAPPAWLEQDFVALARPGRITADLFTKMPLPAGVSSVNIPRVQTGSATAPQSTQNTAVANVDPTTAALTSQIVTIAGSVVVSQQLLDQSPIAFDQMILGDLAADYARALDTMLLSGAGTSGTLQGLFNLPGTTQVPYTQASPTVAGSGGFYSALNKAIAAVSTARYLSPTAICMHPRRWSWVAGSFDAQGRPLVAPSGNAFNQIADAGTVAAQGPVGQMAGLPVFVDANIGITYGAGGNEDRVLVMRAEDVFLWESQLTMATFNAPYSASLGVLFRAHGYTALIASRYPAGIAVIIGSGLVTPVY